MYATLCWALYGVIQVNINEIVLSTGSNPIRS